MCVQGRVLRRRGPAEPSWVPAWAWQLQAWAWQLQAWVWQLQAWAWLATQAFRLAQAWPPVLAWCPRQYPCVYLEGREGLRMRMRRQRGESLPTAPRYVRALKYSGGRVSLALKSISLMLLLAKNEG